VPFKGLIMISGNFLIINDRNIKTKKGSYYIATFFI